MPTQFRNHFGRRVCIECNYLENQYVFVVFQLNKSTIFQKFLIFCIIHKRSLPLTPVPVPLNYNILWKPAPRSSISKKYRFSWIFPKNFGSKLYRNLSIIAEGYLCFLLRISMKNMTRLFFVSLNNNNISQIKAQ